MDIQKGINDLIGMIPGSSVAHFMPLFDEIRNLAKERDEAIAKLAAMESQEPVCQIHDAGFVSIKDACKLVKLPVGAQLYAKQVPADKPAVAVPDAATEEMCEALEEILRDHGLNSDDIGELDKGACWSAMLSAAPSHRQQSARRPQDYAIEHAEYMAVNAEALMEYLNEIHDEEDGELIPDDRFGDYINGLRSGIYEFRKRRDRCPSHESEHGYNRDADEALGKPISVYANQQTEGE